MWIIVKVDHGDADRVHIETYQTRDLAFARIEDLKQMTKEYLDDGVSIQEENESTDCGCGCEDDKTTYWWNVTFNDGLLVTIDAKEV